MPSELTALLVKLDDMSKREMLFSAERLTCAEASSALAALQAENEKLSGALDECWRCADAAVAAALSPHPLRNAERTALRTIMGTSRAALSEPVAEGEEKS